jgi:hypothetical protein
MNATHSGTAVSASERLWIVSANKATDPLTITTASCNRAVMARPIKLILTARTPAWLASSALSIDPDASWLCGTNSPDRNSLMPVG